MSVDDIILNATIKDRAYVLQAVTRAYEASMGYGQWRSACREAKDQVRKSALNALDIRDAAGNYPNQTMLTRALDNAIAAVNPYRPDYRWGDHRDQAQAERNAYLDNIYALLSGN